MVNKTMKQVQELSVPESINYLNVTDAVREQYKIAEAVEFTENAIVLPYVFEVPTF